MTDDTSTLNSGQREVLLCLFIFGPTWDGDIPSKTSRDDLCRAGYARHRQGFAYLTDSGFALCMELGFEREKAKRQALVRKWYSDHERIEYWARNAMFTGDLRARLDKLMEQEKGKL